MADSITRILIIEDEPGIALALYKSLVKASYRVDTAKTASSGLRKVANKQYDLILLDLGLPDRAGLSVCKQLRSDGLTSPIIVLTAEGQTRTKVSLFDAGATDYLTKPFSVDELQARIRAILRQSTPTSEQPPLRVGELTLNRANRTVQRGKTLISLRRKEFSILEYLMINVGRPVTRAGLMHYAWDGTDDGWTNTIDVHIKHLRDKVDRPFADDLIRTVHGIGYKLEVPSYVANKE